MEKGTKLSEIKLAFADLNKSFSIEDRLKLMEETTPHAFEPAETITEDGKIIQGIVLTFLKGNNGGDIKLHYFNRDLHISQFSINRTYRINWYDFKFLNPNDNQKNNLLNVFLHNNDYYICVDTIQKVLDGWKERQTCLMMYNLSHALKKTNEIKYAPVATFAKEFEPLNKATDPNDLKTKDSMFKNGYLTKMNAFII